MAMEEFSCGLVIFDIKGNADASKELAKDVLSICGELVLMMWIGPQNHHCIFHPCKMPLQVINNLSFGFPSSLCGELEVITKIDDLIIGSDP